MVCPTPRSGRLGFVGDYTGAVLSRFQRVRNWSLDITATPQVRVYSGTRFGTQRTPGFIDYTGTFQGWGATPPLFVGQLFTFIGYTAPTDGTPCTPGCALSVPAIVDSLSITWNWTKDNRDVFWQIGFSNTGSLTNNTTFDDPCDDLVYCDPNTCDLAIVLKDPCAANAVVEFCNYTQAVLTFTANNIEYSNASTGCLARKEIGNLDWTLSITDQNPCPLLTPQASYLIELGASAANATKWALSWGMFLGHSNYVIDTETAAMIGKTNNFAMNGVNCCVPSTPVRGTIISPAGTTLWPYATA